MIRPTLTALLYVTVHLLRNLTTAALLGSVYVLLRALYRVSPFHPLSHVPGPLLPRVSSIWLTYHAWIGDECTTVHALHAKYGAIVRTGPNSVDIADGEALQDIYVKMGGFRKPAFYGNFDIDGHKSIFSEIVPERRAPRAKAVLGLFSTSSIRAGSGVLEVAMESFVARLVEEKECSRKAGDGRGVDLLNLTRGLALDVVTGYLFGRSFGALDEIRNSTETGADAGMAANGMVDLFVGVGRFWYLPAKAFHWVDYLDGKFGKGNSEEVQTSLDHVDRFVAGVVRDASVVLEKQKGTTSLADTDEHLAGSYSARLLSAGFSISETRAQCKDLIFAGTDSTGMNLATILFYLSRDQTILSKLKRELDENKATRDAIEIQSLPYLRGVVREGLRLSMANPSRLPRVVPANGWEFQGFQFPIGTEVSCTPFELHLDARIFPDPRVFRPERWVGEAKTLKEMERDMIAFGLGSRQCIARNLATVELYMAVKAVVESDVLAGSHPAKEIKILEWFNSHVIGDKIELIWG